MSNFYLLAGFFSISDVFYFPICFLVLFFIIRSKANSQPNEAYRLFYYRAFYFKVLCVILFTVITEFYFGGGDTGLFYQASKNLYTAVQEDSDFFWLILKTEKLTLEHPLTPFFLYDNYAQDITYNYMISSSNFFPGKFALIPSLLFSQSYLCINMVVGFFALGGAIRLYKFFRYFYPSLWRELAMAAVFLPGVAFWSSGLLKDPITFACIGFFLYSIVNIFFKKEKILISSLVFVGSAYLLINIKIYILLAVVLSLVVWFFAEFNKTIKERVLRYIFTLLTFAGSALVAYFLLNYLTTFEAARDYKLDTLLGNAEAQRSGYAQISEGLKNDSGFQINASNPISLFFESIGATYFRPFVWEINTPIALLSATESAIFLMLTLYIMFKRGVRNFFSVSFSDGRILMCFVFAMVFAFAVGSSTTNFGALSRYKIPCTPFYLVFLTLLYNKQGLLFPTWFNKVVNFTLPYKNLTNVRYRRIH
jgi:hypothetical protein